MTDTNNNNAVIRAGIMCNGLVFPRWQAEAIRHLLLVDGVEISLLIRDAGKADKGGNKGSFSEKVSEARKKGELWKKIRGRLKYRFRWLNLWWIYRSFAEKFVRVPCDDPV